MTKEVMTVDEETSAADAAAIMAEDVHSHGYVLVLRKGRPVGIVTEGDLVKKILVMGATRRTQINTLMTHPLISVDPDADLLRASETMREHGVRKLPVMRDGIVYGILTEDDVAQKIGIYLDKSIRDLVRWTAPLGI